MVALFRDNYFANSLLLFPFTILLRAYSLLYPKAYQISGDQGWISNLIFQKLQDSSLTQSILGIVVIFLQGFMLNIIINNHRLMDRPSLLPGAIFIVMSSLHPSFQGLNPVIIANIFLFFALGNLFQVYRKIKCYNNLFNIGFFLALGSWVYFPFIFLLIPSIFGIITLRNFSIKEQLHFWLGVGVVFYLMFDFQFLFEVKDIYYLPYLKANSVPSFHLETFEQHLYLTMLFIAFLFFIFANNSNLRKRKGIQQQKKITVLMIFLGFSPFGLLFINSFHLSGLLLVIIPISVFISMIIYKIKNSMLAEFAHFILLIITFVFLYL